MTARSAGRLLAAVTIPLALASSPGTAHANPADESAPDQPTRSYRVALSAERLFGVDRQSSATTVAGFADRDVQTTLVSFLGNQTSTTSTHSTMFAPSTIPRVALDVVLWGWLTAGATAAYYRASTDFGTNGGAPRLEEVYIIGPRLGLLHPLAQRLAIWPRLGITFDRAVVGGTGTAFDLKVLTVEAPLLFLASPDLAFSAALTFDKSFSGSYTEDGYGAYDLTTTDLGLQAGMTIFF